MDYQTYESHTDLKSLVSCYWTLEVPKQSEPQRQRIVPDGCIEMAFILGDDIKRYTSESDFILQPRAIDYLVGEGQNATFDKKMLQRIQLMQNMEEKEKSQLLNIIDAVIRDYNAKKAYS